MSAILRGGVNRGVNSGCALVRQDLPKASDDIGRSRCTSKNVKLGFSPVNAGKARRVSVFRCYVTVW
ncbi:hypothetical protein CUJ89_25025 [Burkholderia pyrrocinia]|uniref:Uncharacterized protein n=1 Tax=Burkholderia pyrrocinia TaxID=60550 RepID=A0A2Z5N298_BURPY|nr:hypothetical protein CUJ89_25025 [Burkholderia pyrrocinia]